MYPCISKLLCSVAFILLLAFLSVISTSRNQDGTSISLQFFVNSKLLEFAEQDCPDLKDSIISLRWFLLLILLSKFIAKRISRRHFKVIHIFLTQQYNRQNEAVRLKRFTLIHIRNLLQCCLALRTVLQPQDHLFSFLAILCNFPWRSLWLLVGS